MAKVKEVVKKFKMQAPGGTATPAPPIGPALGANGVNPGQFITKVHAATAALKGKAVAVETTADYEKLDQITKPGRMPGLFCPTNDCIGIMGWHEMANYHSCHHAACCRGGAVAGVYFVEKLRLTGFRSTMEDWWVARIGEGS